MKNLTTLRASKLLVAFTGKSDLIIMETQGTMTQGFVITDEEAGVTRYNVEGEKIINSVILPDSYHGSIEDVEEEEDDDNIDYMEIMEVEMVDIDKETGRTILRPISNVDTTCDTNMEEDVPVADISSKPTNKLVVNKINGEFLTNYTISVVGTPLLPNTKKPVLAKYRLMRLTGRLFSIEKVGENGNTPFFDSATFEEAKELISNTHGIAYIDKKPRKLADLSTLHLTMSAHVITFLDAMGFDKSTITMDQAITLKRQFMNNAEAILGEPKLGVLDAFNS